MRMKRFAMQKLLDWKEDPHRLPLIIRGARQVGKTWLMKEFGRLYFEKCAYINFDRNKRMGAVGSPVISVWIGFWLVLLLKAAWRLNRRIP